MLLANMLKNVCGCKVVEGQGWGAPCLGQKGGEVADFNARCLECWNRKLDPDGGDSKINDAIVACGGERGSTEEEPCLGQKGGNVADFNARCLECWGRKLDPDGGDYKINDAIVACGGESDLITDEIKNEERRAVRQPPPGTFGPEYRNNVLQVHPDAPTSNR